MATASTDNGGAQPLVLRIYHSIVVNAIRVGLGAKLEAGEPLLEETHFLALQEVLYSSYQDVFPAANKNNGNNGEAETEYSNALLKRIVKDFLLKCHPDKALRQGGDFRVAYASFATTSFLNFTSGWLQEMIRRNEAGETTTSIRMEAVDILKMPRLLTTNFEPRPELPQLPHQSLPSSFELVASVRYASTSKPRAEFHRLHIEATKELGQKGIFAEQIFWDDELKKGAVDGTKVYTTHLEYMERPDTSHIPNYTGSSYNATGSSFWSSMGKNPDPNKSTNPRMQVEVRQVVRRLEQNDPTLEHIYLFNQDLVAPPRYMEKMVKALRETTCQIQSIYIHGMMLDADGLKQLFSFLEGNDEGKDNSKTVKSLTLREAAWGNTYRYGEVNRDLARVLKRNKTLEELTIASPFFSVYSFQPAVEGLRENNTLKRVSFTRCAELYTQGVTDILGALNREDSSLESLEIRSTGLTDPVVKELLAFLETHPRLTYLDVRRAHFSEPNVVALQEAAQRRTPPVELLIDPPSIDEA